MIGLTLFSESCVALPRKSQWIHQKNQSLRGFPFVCVFSGLAWLISMLLKYTPDYPIDSLHKHSLMWPFFFFPTTTTWFWRFKKGLRNIWSYKKCLKTRRFDSNITEIKLVSPSEYENVEKQKFISYGSLSVKVSTKTCFLCGFIFLHYRAVKTKWHFELFELIYLTCSCFSRSRHRS